MAIAAHEGSFCFCALKSMNVMDREYQAGLGLDPIKEVCIVGNHHCNFCANGLKLQGEASIRGRCHSEDGIPLSPAERLRSSHSSTHSLSKR